MIAPFRLAVATRCLGEPLRPSLMAAAQMGATGIQLDLRQELLAEEFTQTARRDFLHLLKELGLTPASAVFPLKHPLYSELELERRMAALREAITFAAALKIPTLCLKFGRIPTDDQPKQRTLLGELLSELAAHGNHTGVTMCLTPVGDTPEALGALVSSIKTGLIAIDFDPAAFAMTGQSTNDAITLLYRQLGHLQLRDGLRDLGGTGEETTLGEGTVDWVQVLSTLAQADYNGWLTAVRTQGNSRAADLSRAISLVQSLLLGGHTR